MNSPFFLRRRIFILLIGLLAALLVVLYIRYDHKNWEQTYFVKISQRYKIFGGRDEIASSPPNDSRKNRGLIVDTPGCKIPKLDPFDPSVKDYFEAKKEPYPCPGPPLFMTSQPNGSIALNETILQQYYNLKPDDIVCAYQAIRRKYEKPGNVRENDYDLRPFKNLIFNEPLREDYVIVKCNMGKENFTQYFPLVYLKKSIEEKKTIIPPPVPRLNVILAGIDSISKLNFLRHFEKTKLFMKEKKNFFDMKGYTKLGDNTFPNLTPLLTGHLVEDIWNDTLKDTMYFDDVDIIWKRYSKRGFRTFYAEDSPSFGTFNYGRRGFNITPTDYYIRPLYLAMHSSELRNKGPWYCFNSMIETDVIYDYLRDFVRAMENRPYFAFSMVSALTHDYLNYAGYADFPTVKLLDDLWEIGALDNSVLIIFGDHGLRFGGIRYTYIGKYEERMPFMYIRFPPWFLEQYPDVEKNLRTNQERLVTLFDIHATMIHLLDLNKELSPAEKAIASPYGVSLMTEISPYRTCESATIFPHWCACHVFHPLPVADPTVLKSAEATVDFLNQKLKGTTCAVLELRGVVSASLSQLNDLVLRFVKHENIVIDRNVVYGDRVVKYEYVWVTMSTAPGEGIFEGTVRHDVEDGSLKVLDVFRKNSYSAVEDSGCCDNPELIPFCACA